MNPNLIDVPPTTVRAIARRSEAALAVALLPRQSAPLLRVPEASRVALEIKEEPSGLLNLVRSDSGAVFCPCATRAIALRLQAIYEP